MNPTITFLTSKESHTPRRELLLTALARSERIRTDIPKLSLPCIVPSALWPGDDRKGSQPIAPNVVAHTGLFFIDVDTDDARTDLALETAKSWPHTICVQRSFSGALHVFFAAAPVPAPPNLSVQHTAVIKAAQTIFAADTGLTPDPAVIDIARRCFIAANQPVHIPDHEPLLLIPDLAAVPTGGRHDAMLKWACKQVENDGRSKQNVRSWLVAANTRLGEAETEAGLDAMLNNLTDFAESGIVTTSDDVVIMTSAADIATTLEHHPTFRARYNVLRLSTEISTAEHPIWHHLPPDRLHREAYLALPPHRWQAGKTVSGQVPPAALKSAIDIIARPVNPVAELLEVIREIEPATPTQRYTACAEAFQCDPADKPHYLDLFECIYTDVALRMLLCENPERNVQPSFFATLVGPQGCGKTAFIEELLPTPFTPYRGALTASRWSDAVMQVGSKFLMEIPEISARRSYYDGLSKGDLRSLVTDGTFDAVHKYDKAPSTTKNNSVLIATANSDGNVLLDGVGNRRQVIVQFPAYDSTEASMAAGAKSADYLRAHRDALLAYGLQRADEIIGSSNTPWLGVRLDAAYEHLWVQAQEQSDESDRLDILRAFVAIILDLDGWREESAPGVPPEETHGYCTRGGVDPKSLRCLASVYAGFQRDHISAKQVNAELRLTPGIVQASNPSPLHKRRGLRVVSGAVLAALVKRVSLVDEAVEAIRSDPGKLANPLYAETLRLEV